MDSTQRFKIRFAKAEEMKRVRELVVALHDYQKMECVYRLPTEEDLLNELTCKDTESGRLLSNRFGTFTVVVIDKEKKIEKGEYILGYLMYAQSYSILIGRQFYVNSLFLEEDYRGCGLGTKLMEFMQAHAKAIGFTTLDIPVMDNNYKGLKFYSRFNYRDVDDEFLLMGRTLADPSGS